MEKEREGRRDKRRKGEGERQRGRKRKGNSNPLTSEIPTAFFENSIFKICTRGIYANLAPLLHSTHTT